MLEKAIELKPEEVAYYEKAGNLLSEIREYSTALKYYKKTVEINPNCDSYWNNLAVWLLLHGI